MAGLGLKRRVEALEGGDQGFKPFVFIMQTEGESDEATIARHEAVHGPLDLTGRSLGFCVIKTGVSRDRDSWVN